MKQKLFFPLFLIFLYSCDSDSIKPSQENKIASYHTNYMEYYTGNPFQTLKNSIVNLKYNSENKLIKRVGGLFSIPGATGYHTIFTNHIYDEVSYLDNKIVIENKSSSSDIHPKKEIVTFLLDENQKIKQRIIASNRGDVFDFADTLNYFYDSENRLNTTKSSNDISTFYFNDKNNLDSIVTIKNHLSFPIKEVEIFENFDNSKNPLKHLNIFPETFKRSLSENNYSVYRKLDYGLSHGGEKPEEQITEWELQYDENGNVIF